ncbi:MAG: AtpZ/AtpI family protein [Patescibacteria group bacterium]|nr:AtpZ/AtpI family protein [Patescibacteria group bacterium]
MIKTNAHQVVPSPPRSKLKKVDGRSNGAIFGLMVLDMTWKLIISFLAPVLVGDYLDHRYHNKGLFLLIGLILGLILGIVVVYYSYKSALTVSTQPKKEIK